MDCRHSGFAGISYRGALAFHWREHMERAEGSAILQPEFSTDHHYGHESGLVLAEINRLRVYVDCPVCCASSDHKIDGLLGRALTQGHSDVGFSGKLLGFSAAHRVRTTLNGQGDGPRSEQGEDTLNPAECGEFGIAFQLRLAQSPEKTRDPGSRLGRDMPGPAFPIEPGGFLER